MGNATRPLVPFVCCWVFGGMSFVLEVGELHMNWDASDASVSYTQKHLLLTSWSVGSIPPEDSKKKPGKPSVKPMVSEFWAIFCPTTKTFANWVGPNFTLSPKKKP